MKLCNFCELRKLEEHAQTVKAKVVRTKHPLPGFPNGEDVFLVHAENHVPVWAAWFAKIPEECEC